MAIVFYEDSHGLFLKRLQLTPSEAVDPASWDHSEMDDQVQDVVTVNPNTVAVMLSRPLAMAAKLPSMSGL